MSTDLPDFDEPPVGEMALGFQFQPLPALRGPQIGLLWGVYRAAGLSVLQEQPPLPAQAVELPPGTPPEARFQIEFGDLPPPPRCWFLNTDGTTLVQVQQNRFVHNWRQVAAGERYPRYDRLRHSFEEHVERFYRFVEEEQLGAIVPDQCEVTYVNHLRQGEGWTRLGEVDHVLTVFERRYSDDFLREPDDVRLSERHVISEDGAFLGRLHITLEPVLRLQDRQPMLVLTLAARGRPLVPTIDGVLRFFDVGHRWIVKGFASITTPRMHAIWKRRQ